MNGAPANASTGTSAASSAATSATVSVTYGMSSGSSGRSRARSARERSGCSADRPGARGDVDAEADGVGGHDDVAVQHGGVDAVAAHRLQRDLGRELRLLDRVEDRALAAQRPVLGQAAPGLAHEPHRRVRGRSRRARRRGTASGPGHRCRRRCGRRHVLGRVSTTLAARRWLTGHGDRTQPDRVSRPIFGRMPSNDPAAPRSGRRAGLHRPRLRVPRAHPYLGVAAA